MSGMGMRGSEGLVLTGVGGIDWGDVLRPYVASMATGKSDFEALRPWFGQTWMAKALRIDRVPSPETLRQRLDSLADGHPEEALQIVRQASLELIRRSGAAITPCSTRHLRWNWLEETQALSPAPVASKPSVTLSRILP